MWWVLVLLGFFLVLVGLLFGLIFFPVEASVRASAGNELFSLFTVFICDDIMEGHFRKICCCCLYFSKSSVFLLPSLKLYSAKSPFVCPGGISVSKKFANSCPGHIHNEK